MIPHKESKNNIGRIYPTYIIFRCLTVLFALYVAISAINGFIAAGLERDFCLLAALSAYRREHLPWTPAHTAATATAATSKTLRPSVLPAGRASLGLIGIALRGKEFLFFYGKGERFSTIGTLERLLLKSHG
jgi:hypothetical protein